MPLPETRAPLRRNGTTPFPNHLLDDVMPSLTDTEWRLLCVLVRQTIGWRNSGGTGRKDWDWLTHRQLQARTGRASEAVCRAIEGLTAKGLIEVRNGIGQILKTAAERRRATQLLFRVTLPEVCGKRQENPGGSFSESETTFSKTEIRKAKTTKETLTKGISREIGRSSGGSFGPTGEDNGSAPGRPVDNPVDNSDVRRFFSLYRQLFTQVSSRGEPPLIFWGRDSRTVRQLLSSYSCECLLDLLMQFFSSHDPWIRRSGYSIGAFRSSINSLLCAERPESAAPVVRGDGWTRVKRPL